MKKIIGGLILLWAVPVYGQDLTSNLTDCDEREDYSLCVVKNQRDNALDNQAIALGQVARSQKYWREYLIGLNDQLELRTRAEEKLKQYWTNYIEGLITVNMSGDISLDLKEGVDQK